MTLTGVLLVGVYRAEGESLGELEIKGTSAGRWPPMR
jgi:hypothetical protein